MSSDWPNHWRMDVAEWPNLEYHGHRRGHARVCVRRAGDGTNSLIPVTENPLRYAESSRLRSDRGATLGSGSSHSVADCGLRCDLGTVRMFTLSLCSSQPPAARGRGVSRTLRFKN